MLQALRNKLHGWPAIVLLGICVFAVAFFGIESYFTADTQTDVAQVGKRAISQQDYQNRLNQLRQDAAAEGQDPTLYDQLSTKRRIVDALIDQQLLAKTAATLQMTVPNDAVADYIAHLPPFQVDGHFDQQTYRQVLAAQQMTPAGFEAQVRASLAERQLPDALNDGTLISSTQVQQFLDLQLQRRSFRYALWPAVAPADRAISAAEVKTYYQQHLSDYMRPEQVSLQYLEIDDQHLDVPANPGEADLRKLYDNEQNHFSQAEQREVSDILIAMPQNASSAQQQAAAARAKQLATEATPANFASLASQHSDDQGSKRQGGDLGWLEKGIASAAFDQALFSLQKGQISAPVFVPGEGYHILWLRDVRAGKTQSFEEARPKLLSEWQHTELDRRYHALAGRLTDATYQNPGSLTAAAQALHLNIQSLPLFSRQGGSGLAADPKVLKAAFSDEVLNQGNNSGLIPLGPRQGIVIHLDQHLPTAPLPLASVEPLVRQAIFAARAQQAAMAAAKRLLAQLDQGANFPQLAAEAGVAVQHQDGAVRSGEDSQAVPPAVLHTAFQLPKPVADHSSYGVADLGGGVAALVALDRVQGADPAKFDEAQRQALQQQMREAYGNLETDELLHSLRAKTKIQLYQAHW